VTLGILTQYYPPEIGAPQARLSALATQLARRGHRVVVLTALPNYPLGRFYPGYRALWRCEGDEGFRIFRTWLYPTQSFRPAKRLASYFSFVVSAALAGAAVMPRLDWLITESPPLFLGIAGYWLSRLKQARWVFNVSDLWPKSAVQLGAVGDGLWLRVAERLEAFCYRKARVVTGQSGEIVADIRRRFPGVTVWKWPNGVDTEHFAPGRRSESLVSDLRKRARCVALYAGLHGMAQGLGQVLEAAGRLRDRKDLRIVLVGDGPEKPRLIAQARQMGLGNVAFLDAVPRDRAPELIASADIALAPLRRRLWGAVPSKIYEGMASGVPVVSCGEGEAAQIIETAGAGLVVPPGDSGALAEALRVLADDPALRERLGRAGRKAAVELFDRQKINDHLITRLEQWPAC